MLSPRQHMKQTNSTKIIWNLLDKINFIFLTPQSSSGPLIPCVSLEVGAEGWGGQHLLFLHVYVSTCTCACVRWQTGWPKERHADLLSVRLMSLTSWAPPPSILYDLPSFSIEAIHSFAHQYIHLYHPIWLTDAQEGNETVKIPEPKQSHSLFLPLFPLLLGRIEGLIVRTAYLYG